MITARALSDGAAKQSKAREADQPECQPKFPYCSSDAQNSWISLVDPTRHHLRALLQPIETYSRDLCWMSRTNIDLFVSRRSSCHRCCRPTQNTLKRNKSGSALSPSQTMSCQGPDSCPLALLQMVSRCAILVSRAGMNTRTVDLRLICDIVSVCADMDLCCVLDATPDGSKRPPSELVEILGEAIQRGQPPFSYLDGPSWPSRAALTLQTPMLFMSYSRGHHLCQNASASKNSHHQAYAAPLLRRALRHSVRHRLRESISTREHAPAAHVCLD